MQPIPKLLCAGRPARRFVRRRYGPPASEAEGIPGLQLQEGLDAYRVEQHAEIRSYMSIYAEQAGKESRTQSLKERKVPTTNRLGRDMLPTWLRCPVNGAAPGLPFSW